MKISESNFRQQMKEDIVDLQEELSWDKNISKPEYAFNYWVLSHIYSLDTEECSNHITEYNDKGIDCFVHYKERKQLHIIQNKYYSKNTAPSSKDVSDLVTRSIDTLDAGKYRKSKELQEIYNRAKEDAEYSIYLDFLVTSNKQSEDANVVIKGANQRNDVIARLFYLDDIYSKYYGEPYEDTKELKVNFDIATKGLYLAIRPEAKAYRLPPEMLEAYYVMTKVSDIYAMMQQAEEKKYLLFEENIRRYLGGMGNINKQMIETLKDEKERAKFFYYNNGITIICDEAKADSRRVAISNPQIVNGCQTVNTIKEVLDHIDDRKESFKDVYVMAKILVSPRNEYESKQGGSFYEKIVKYTNSQNSLNERVFGAWHTVFDKIQKGLEREGFLLVVKQSDKYQFKTKYAGKKSKGELLELAKSKAQDFYEFEFKSITKVQISLETLIQIIGALKHEKGAYFAYTKKSTLLRTDTKNYEEFSVRIKDWFTFGSMVKLILFYQRAEFDKKQSDDGRSPSPWYLLHFLGYYLRERGIDESEFINRITLKQMGLVYDFFRGMPKKYYDDYLKTFSTDYNKMLKKEVDEGIMKSVVYSHFEGLRDIDSERHSKLMAVFDSCAPKASAKQTEAV